MDEINNPEVGPTELYGRTKLAMILGAKYGLVDRVIKPNGDNVYALSVHPGTVGLAVVFILVVSVIDGTVWIGQYRHAAAVERRLPGPVWQNAHDADAGCWP